MHQGDYGKNGSVIQWKYTLGKLHIIKVIEGDHMMEFYKNIIITSIDFIAWTIDYELLNVDNPHPLPLLGFLIEMTKDIESHIFG
ncbi:hypothetical protein ACJIZ3_004202 [Penstemon smallii]|uniref:Uncharacterized protein n=1 Tax=Penstemon smallii TaxID=265156 RepID=A0ABD3S1I8_9LAMI